jgi:hypothetical protein
VSAIDYNYWEEARLGDHAIAKKFWHELPPETRAFLSDRGWNRETYDQKQVEIMRGIPQPRGFSESGSSCPANGEFDASPSGENGIRYLEECR